MRWFVSFLGIALVLAPLSVLAQTAPSHSELDAIEAMIESGDAAAALERLDAYPDEDFAAGLVRAEALIQLRRRGEGLALAERLVADAADSGTRAEAHWLAGRAAAGQGEDQVARSHLQSALELFGDGLEPSRRTRLLIGLANSESFLSEFDRARRHLEEAQALWEPIGDPEQGARLFDAWANWEKYRQDPISSLSYRERALAMAREGEDRGYERVLLTNLGQAQMALHNYSEALIHLHRALDLSEPDTRGAAIIHATIGICEFELNRLDEAEAGFKAAQAIAERLDNRALLQWTYGELGLVANKRGDYESALGLLSRAAALAEAINNRRDHIIWTINTGMVYRDQERYEEALEHYRRAESLTIEGQRPFPSLYKHMGQSYAGLGDDAAAAELFRRALELAEANDDGKFVWETQRELARLHRRAGDVQAAEAAYRAAIARIEEIRRVLLLAPLKSSFFSDKVAVYEEYVDFLIDQGRAREAFEVAERSRARAFLESLAEARAGLHRELPPEWLERERELLAELSRLQASAREAASDPALDSAIQATEAALNELRLRVRAERPQWYALHTANPRTLEEIQRVLAPNEVIVAFFLGEQRSHRWLVHLDRVDHAELPPRAKLEAEIRAAYARVQDPGRADPDPESLARRLSLPVSRENARWLIIPSGILHYFPLEALAGPDGDFLGARLASSYWPSGSAIAEIRSRPGPVADGRILALADPLSEGEPAPLRGAPLSHLRSFGALPHSQKELETLTELFGPAATETLVGQQATEGNFKRRPLASYSLIHLATHGWLDGDSPVWSGLVLRPSEGEDGLLQFHEILNLSLRAGLVTLSACQSGLGELVTGEGMVGIARAFFHAGTPSILASLWNVNDEASAVLMDRFYRELARGASKVDALAAARRQLIDSERYRHPYYWAGFVLVGEGDQLTGLPTVLERPWFARGPLLAALAIVLLLGAAVGRLSRRGARSETRSSRSGR